MDLSAALASPLTGERPRADYDAGCLVGTRCRACHTPVWPARAICPRCGSAEVTSERFNPTGALVTYTTVHVPRPGLEVPYVLGQVRIDDGPVVFGHVRGLQVDASVPLAVRLHLAPGRDLTPWYWFEPVGQGS